MENSRKNKAKGGRLLPKTDAGVKVDLEALRPLTAAASLKEVRFIGFSANATPKILDVAERDFDQKIRYKAELLNSEKDDTPRPLLVHLDFSYQAVRKDNLICEITAQLLAFYNIQEEVLSKSSQADRQLFARTNGPYTCWPYLREFVGSSAARLGLPRTFLPIWRLPAMLPAEGQFSELELPASAT